MWKEAESGGNTTQVKGIGTRVHRGVGSIRRGPGMTVISITEVAPRAMSESRSRGLSVNTEHFLIRLWTTTYGSLLGH